MNEQPISKEELQKALDAIPPYARTISTAMVLLGHAVELALNMRDRAVIQEMKVVCSEIFNQAEVALNENKQMVN